MLGLLKDLITKNPYVEEVDFSNEGISYVDPHSVDLLGRFTELKKVSNLALTPLNARCCSYRSYSLITRFANCRTTSPA